MVSFERVFEILDMPLEIAEKPDAITLTNVGGEVTFDHVFFNYNASADKVRLRDVERAGRMDNVVAVLPRDNSGRRRPHTWRPHKNHPRRHPHLHNRARA